MISKRDHQIHLESHLTIIEVHQISEGPQKEGHQIPEVPQNIWGDPQSSAGDPLIDIEILLIVIEGPRQIIPEAHQAEDLQMVTEVLPQTKDIHQESSLKEEEGLLESLGALKVVSHRMIEDQLICAQVLPVKGLPVSRGSHLENAEVHMTLTLVLKVHQGNDDLQVYQKALLMNTGVHLTTEDLQEGI